MNLLREQVKVRLDDAPETPKCYHNCEICVVRNGKGKRPEGYVAPPPEELAKLRKTDPKEALEERPASEKTALSEALGVSFRRLRKMPLPCGRKSCLRSGGGGLGVRSGGGVPGMRKKRSMSS